MKGSQQTSILMRAASHWTLLPMEVHLFKQSLESHTLNDSAVMPNTDNWIPYNASTTSLSDYCWQQKRACSELKINDLGRRFSTYIPQDTQLRSWTTLVSFCCHTDAPPPAFSELAKLCLLARCFLTNRGVGPVLLRSTAQRTTTSDDLKVKFQITTISTDKLKLPKVKSNHHVAVLI